MDSFTEKLQFYINRKKVSLKKLSELTGLSRTTLKRYVEGVRVPKKEEYVGMIMEELSLSEEEKKELLEIYRRKLVGEKRYRIGKLVLDVQPDDDLLHKKEYVGLDVLEEAIQKVFQSGVNIQIVLNNSLDVIYDIFLKSSKLYYADRQEDGKTWDGEEVLYRNFYEAIIDFFSQYGIVIDKNMVENNPRLHVFSSILLEQNNMERIMGLTNRMVSGSWNIGYNFTAELYNTLN